MSAESKKTDQTGADPTGADPTGADQTGADQMGADPTGAHAPAVTIVIKRAYDDASPSDGVRVLVDRLWPRGVTTEHAHLDAWLKDIAPTPELRTWWNHDPERLDDFAARYRAELDGNQATLKAIDEFWALSAAGGTTTLVYGAKDPVVNHARVLAEYLTGYPTGSHA
ncbi:hypothetical protein GCM10022381_33030 [Leifsonia kafniensis]|uniref:DUF488 family protein n=1 Tax=Leifsonia kafniensis TaxID=475957 RepID=A0ABP7KXU3_9MICO